MERCNGNKDTFSKYIYIYISACGGDVSVYVTMNFFLIPIIDGFNWILSFSSYQWFYRLMCPSVRKKAKNSNLHI